MIKIDKKFYIYFKLFNFYIKKDKIIKMSLK